MLVLKKGIVRTTMYSWTSLTRLIPSLDEFIRTSQVHLLHHKFSHIYTLKNKFNCGLQKMLYLNTKKSFVWLFDNLMFQAFFFSVFFGLKSLCKTLRSSEHRRFLILPSYNFTTSCRVEHFLMVSIVFQTFFVIFFGLYLEK